MKLHMFLGFDNLSYTVAALSKQSALEMLERSGVAVKCYIGQQ